MTTPHNNEALVRAATDAAFGLVELIRTSDGDVPAQVPAIYDQLLNLTAAHGTRALGLVWLIWGRMISLGLDESGRPDAALFAEIDGDPDVAYARRAVTLARQNDGEGIAELVDAAVRDQQRNRTGACIETICAFLSVGAVRYGRPTEKPTHHE